MSSRISTPIVHPSAWRSVDFKSQDSWIERLCAEEVAELDAALARASSSGSGVTELKKADFPLDALGRRIEDWADLVNNGRGFLLVRGLPADRYTDLQLRTIFWGIGLHMGVAMSQNSYGDLLGDVFDEGVKMGKRVRGYRTNSQLVFHTDRADTVGLLCVHKAKSGGISRLVSSMAMHNEILRNHPEYLEPLYKGYFFMNVEEGGDSAVWRVPIYSVVDGVLSCRASRNTIDIARNLGLAKYDDLEAAALEYFDATAARPDMRIDMDLERGDMQFINNYTTLHSRTEYQDHPAPAPRRLMVRLWLMVHGKRRPRGPDFQREYSGVPVTLSRQPGATTA